MDWFQEKGCQKLVAEHFNKCIRLGFSLMAQGVFGLNCQHNFLETMLKLARWNQDLDFLWFLRVDVAISSML